MPTEKRKDVPIRVGFISREKIFANGLLWADITRVMRARV